MNPDFQINVSSTSSIVTSISSRYFRAMCTCNLPNCKLSSADSRELRHQDCKNPEETHYFCPILPHCELLEPQYPDITLHHNRNPDRIACTCQFVQMELLDRQKGARDASQCTNFNKVQWLQGNLSCPHCRDRTLCPRSDFTQHYGRAGCDVAVRGRGKPAPSLMVCGPGNWKVVEECLQPRFR